MNTIHLTRTLALIACVALLTGCANKANMVRPDAQSASEALGEVLECTPEMLKDSNGTERFVVEWADGDRATLESEMASGVALVQFTCEGMKVLRGCAIPGEYGYVGISKKTKSLQISDAAEAQANFSSPTLTGSVKAAFAQGRALNLGYVMVGVQKTNTVELSKDQIKRDACKDATHFVYETKVGAFTMATGEKGEAMAAGELLGVGGASASTSSSKNVAATDGDPDACEGASKKDEDPVDGCQAVMRVSILPLAQGKIASVSKDKGPKKIDTRTCPAGMVRQDEICVEKKEAATFLCDEGDASTCKAQCEKGHLGSCGRYAAIVKEELPSIVGFGDAEQEAKALAQKHAPFIEKFEAACVDEWETMACEAAVWLIRYEDGSGVPSDAAEAQRLLTLTTTGCEWGNTNLCIDITNIYGEGFWSDQGIQADARKMVEIAGEGCDTGSPRSCFVLGETLYGSIMGELKSDPKQAAKYFAKACYGGLTEGCFWASIAYGTRDADTCTKLVAENLNKQEMEMYISLSLPDPSKPADLKKYCEATADLYDMEKASGLADKACYVDGGEFADTTCSISVDFDAMRSN